VIQKIKHLFPEAVSSRSESKNLDNKKVDICNTGDFYIQCKNTSSKVDYHKVISEMPKDKICLIAHKYTKKSNKNFVKQGEYIILKFEDFISLISK